MVAGEVLLRGVALSRRWGGLLAVDRVSLELCRGTVHALIGTNGAGKSTLIDLLAGALRPTSGRVEYGGRDVSGWSQPRRARAGIGRSFQRSTFFPPFSVHENVRLVAQARRPRPWAWWQAAEADRHTLQAARTAAERAGLGPLLELPAGRLSHGHRRQLEIALCLAGDPQVLLLDEPLAGLGPEEAEGMLGLIGSLRAGRAVLLVEHDMDAVFRIADRVTVMAGGVVIAGGTPAEVRADPQVQSAYLGGG